MTYLRRYKYHVLAASILMMILFMGMRNKISNLTETPKVLPRIQTQGQLEHALELFPRAQHASLLYLSAEMDQRPLLFNMVKNSLPKRYKHKAFEISKSVIVEANHHGMDPFFLLAVIATESSFNIKARGSRGEIGLMQLMPKTAESLAVQAGLSIENLNLEDPATNIRLGATYFAQLRRVFDHHGSRYVAAYNMGSANVRRLLRKNIEPHIYSGKVFENYLALYEKVDKAQAEKRDVASAD